MHPHVVNVHVYASTRQRHQEIDPHAWLTMHKSVPATYATSACAPTMPVLKKATDTQPAVARLLTVSATHGPGAWCGAGAVLLSTKTTPLLVSCGHQGVLHSAARTRTHDPAGQG